MGHPTTLVAPSLYHHLFEAKARKPYVDDNAPLFIDGAAPERSLSFVQLREHVRTFCAHLADKDIKKGDIVAICSPGAIEYPVAFHGAIASGAVAMLVPDALISQEITALFKVAAPSLVVTHVKTHQAVTEALRACNLDASVQVIAMDQVLRMPRPMSSPMPVMHVEPDTLALLLQTSGSTGPPKLVSVSHRAAIARATVSSSHFEPLRKDGYEHRVLALSRMGGGIQVNNTMMAGVLLGLPHYVFQTADLHTVCRLVEKHRITVLYHFGWMVAKLASDPDVDAFDLSSVRYWVTGGQVVGRHVIDQALRHLSPGARITCNYGSSEAHNIFNYHHAPDGAWEVISYDGVQIKLVGDHGKVLDEPGLVGELCIKSPMNTSGYYNNDSATRKALDDDGFLHTGDLFVADTEGRLRFVNRKTERIMRYTKDLCPKDIEDICMTFSDLIQECRVIGAYDARRCVELPRAFIILACDKECDKKQFAKQLVEHVNARAPGPEMELEGGVQFVVSWPLTSSGKIDLSVLRKRGQAEINRELYGTADGLQQQQQQQQQPEVIPVICNE